MANIVPSGTLSYVYQDTAASDPITASNPIPIAKMRHLTFYFADADNTELFAMPPGTVACAWQPANASTFGGWSVGATGLIFTSAGGGARGWLHVLANGTLKTGTTTDEAPVSMGTAGFVHPTRSMFLGHRSATPNNLTSGRCVNKSGLRLRIFEFATTTDADVWQCESASLCPGIVAVAWQGNDPTEDVNVTQRANGDVVFLSDSADYGWLWAWSR